MFYVEQVFEESNVFVEGSKKKLQTTIGKKNLFHLWIGCTSLKEGLFNARLNRVRPVEGWARLPLA